VTAPPRQKDPFDLEISDRAPEGWSNLLDRDPAAEYTHTQHWTETVCAHLTGAKAFWVSLRRSGELVGGLNAVSRSSVRKVLGLPLRINRLDSSYAGTSGGPVIAADLEREDRDRAFRQLVAALGVRRRGLLGSCGLALSPAQEKIFGGWLGSGSDWVRQDAPTAVVSLSGGIEQVDRERLVMNKRNERNRGLRRGAEVFATDDADLLAEYYEIYLQASRLWGVTPVPLGLLQGLLKDEEGRVFFTCVRLEGRVIGGHLNLHFGDRVLAWNGVTDPEFARTHFPATLCFWGDLVEACRRGAAWLDFGGSGNVSSLEGFKKYFGATLQMRGFYIRDGAATKLLRQGRDLLRPSRTRESRLRWHDARPGPDEREGP
jgi:hypothetical protein